MGNEQLLYESKGCRKSQRARCIVPAIILVMIGIVFIVMSQAKHEVHEVVSGSGYMENGVYHQTSGKKGYMGGGDMFPEEVKTMLTVMGVISVLGAALSIDTLIGMNRCWIKIYQDRVEGQTFKMGVKKEIIDCAYPQIQSVQMEKDFLILNTGGRKLKLLSHDNKRSFELINQFLRRV